MRTLLVISAVVLLLALLQPVFSIHGVGEVAWARANNPFMRMAKRIDDSMVETEARAEVKRATAVEEPEQIVSEGGNEVAEGEQAVVEPAQQEEQQAEAEAQQEQLQEQQEAKQEEVQAQAEAVEEKQEAAKEEQKQVEEQIKEKMEAVDEAIKAKETQEEAEKTEKRLEEKANEEYERIKEMSKNVAAKTLEMAREKAKLIVETAQARAEAANAKNGGGSCCEGCSNNPCEKKDKKEDYVDANLLVPLKTDNSAAFDGLKLDDNLSADPQDFAEAEGQLKKADEAHEAFLKKHENDCKGPICPFKGGLVPADAA